MIRFLPPSACFLHLAPGASPAGRVAGGAFLFEGLVDHVMLMNQVSARFGLLWTEGGEHVSY